MIKRIARAALAHPVTYRMLRPLSAGAGSILMLHRFADPDYGAPGVSPRLLAQRLETLHRLRYRMLRVDDLLRSLIAGVRPRAGTVAFTVDDGYRDFARIAAPIFAR